MFALVFTRILFTKISGNAKTGPIPVSMSVKATCPDACPLKAKGCYANTGPINIHWTRLTTRKVGIAWSEFLTAIKSLRVGTLWRHNQAGDLPGKNNEIDGVALAELVTANRNRKGFTYTHKPVLFGQCDKATVKANRKAIEHANANGFTINLSGNTLSHADELLALAIGPVVAILPSDTKANTFTPKGARVIVCPATIRDDVSCATCKLCQWGKREYVIGFPAHGNAAKTVNAIASS